MWTSPSPVRNLSLKKEGRAVVVSPLIFIDRHGKGNTLKTEELRAHFATIQALFLKETWTSVLQ